MVFQKYIRMVFHWGSACDTLSCLLVKIISPLTDKSSQYVENFVRRISYASIRSNQMMSLDLVSLFTKVTTDEVLAVVQEKLIVDSLLVKCKSIPTDNQMEMLILCRKNLLRVGIWYILRRRRTGYGFLIVWPVLDNIYMKYFEEMALRSTSLKQSVWLSYVDGTFVLWPHQKDVKKLHGHVNSIRLSI